MKVENINSESFSSFATVLQLPNEIKTQIENVMAKNAIPQEGNVYFPHDEKFNDCKAMQFFFEQFGAMPVQMGYCNGKGRSMDALEYHKTPEVIFAVTDMILLLGNLPLENQRYNSANLKAFMVENGTLLELKPQVLHFAPIAVENDGFKALIVLPKGTNYPLPQLLNNKDKMLFATNKWLLAHKDATSLINDGAYVGVDGENITF